MSIVFYADDFVIIHESEEIVLKAKEFVEEWLKGIGLTLSQFKARIVHTLKSKDGNKGGFDFLGFSGRQYSVTTCARRYKTLTKPSPEGQKRHRKAISERLKNLTAATQEEVIDALNPIIKGWSNYYRSGVSSKVFGNMDNYVFQKLWKWSRWRHQNKGLRQNVNPRKLNVSGLLNHRFARSLLVLCLHISQIRAFWFYPLLFQGQISLVSLSAVIKTVLPRLRIETCKQNHHNNERCELLLYIAFSRFSRTTDQVRSVKTHLQELETLAQIP
ncbi:hypothetical protein FACS189472_07280 [Alphaproteobacteria bacterium]|nr:hypothetical protein FACS189472_07280 [Alphaproteobacteria bacterium]